MLCSKTASTLANTGIRMWSSRRRPAIVPEELLCRVQRRMEKNKRAPAHTKAKESEFLLATKLFCGKCERMMVGESGKSHTGAIYYYYKCGNAKRKKGCDKKAVKKIGSSAP